METGGGAGAGAVGAPPPADVGADGDEPLEVESPAALFTLSDFSSALSDAAEGIDGAPAVDDAPSPEAAESTVCVLATVIARARRERMNIAPPTTTTSAAASSAGTRNRSRAEPTGGAGGSAGGAGGSVGAVPAERVALDDASPGDAADSGITCVGARWRSSALIPVTAATIAAPNSLAC
jgi:hypothetical protein